MTDPLSIAGSVAGLVSIADSVFRTLHRYTKAVRDAEKDILYLKNEVAELAGVLHNLQLVAQDLEDDDGLRNSLRLENVNSCLSTLYEFKDKLSKLDFPETKRLQSTFKKLTWPFKANETQGLRDEIRQHRDILSLAVSADSMSAMLKCLSSQASIMERVGDIETLLRDKDSIATRITINEQRHRVLEFFLVVDPQTTFYTSVRLRHPTTGFWLTEDNIFCSWLRETGTSVWLSGIPGAGKTILSGLIVQACMARTSGNRALAYYYCDYRNTQSRTAINMLSSLASQIARQNEASFAELEHYYRWLHPAQQLQRRPSLEDLMRVLKSTCSHFEDVRIVIDGLDECGENTSTVIEQVRTLMTWQDHKVSVAVLSRDEADIRHAFHSQICSHLQVAARTQDIEHYVRSEIEERAKNNTLRIRSIQLKEEIIEQLVFKANGMFRWVSCQLDQLCELSTDAQRRKALTALPKTLHETYERILRGINDSNVSLVQKTLYWTAYASPRLSIEQLLDAISVDDEDVCLNPEARPEEEDVLRACGSLVRKEGRRLELAHFTVHEYLRSLRGDQDHLAEYRLGDSVRLTLARTCLRYLCFPDFDVNPPPTREYLDGRNEDNPFYEHAAYHWSNYCGDEWDHPLVISLLRRLFDPKRTYSFINFILQILLKGAAFEKFPNIFNTVTSGDFTPLHAASLLHLEEVCQWLLEQGSKVNQPSLRGTPLECAIFGAYYSFHDLDDRYDELVKPEAIDTIYLLLEGGADCAIDSSHSVSLSLATLWGSNEAASPFAELLYHGMPLHDDTMAVLEDYPSEYLRKVLTVLETADKACMDAQQRAHLMRLAHDTSDLPSELELAATETLSDEAYQTILWNRVRYDQRSALEDIIKDSRFSVNMGLLNLDGTLLHFAATNRCIEVMKYLLELGFDPMRTDDHGRTVLHLSVTLHQDDLVRSLIEMTDLAISDVHGRTVWHEAARAGADRTLELLFERHHAPSDLLCLRTTNDHGSNPTPIFEALLSRQEDTTILLLERMHATCLDFDAWDFVKTCTMYGLLRPYNKFKELGYAVDVQSPCGRTPLFYITSLTTIGMFHALIATGYNPSDRDSSGRTILHALLSCEHRDHMASSAGHRFSGVDAELYRAIMRPEFCKVADDTGKSIWYYFCTAYVREVLRWRSATEINLCKDFAVYLYKERAVAGHEELLAGSGISFLIENILDALQDEDASDLIINAVADMLLQVIELIDVSTQCIVDAQFVRLMIWSVSSTAWSLLESLLALGLDVHARSLYHENKSTVEFFCWVSGDSSMFARVIDHADLAQLNSLNVAGRALIHALCISTPSTRTEDAEKLRILLEKGVDPNTRLEPSGATPIHMVARRGLVEAFQLLQRYGADLHLTNISGWGIIGFAVQSAPSNFLKYLLEEVVDEEVLKERGVLNYHEAGPLGSADYFRCTPFQLATFLNFTDSEEKLQILLESGRYIDIHEGTAEGLTPLHFAAFGNSKDIAIWLIRNGASLEASSNIECLTPLHMAMAQGHSQMVQMLVEAGASFNPDARGRSPEMLVDASHRTAMLEVLQKCIVPAHILTNLARRFSMHELSAAIYDGNAKKCLGILQSQGVAAFSAPMPCGGCSPLIASLIEEQWEVAELFIQHEVSTGGFTCERHRSRGPNLIGVIEIAVSKPAFNSVFESLLDLCLKQDHHWIWASTSVFYHAAEFNCEAIDILVTHIRKHQPLYESLKALLYVPSDFSSRNLDLVKSLIDGQQMGSAPRIERSLIHFGVTPLHVACFSKRYTSVAKLLAYGADVNARGISARTPLHDAAHSGCANSIELLLRHGASTRLRDKDLRTPFMVACQEGHLGVVTKLLQFEEDKNDVDIYQMNAVNLSTQADDPKVFIHLIDTGYDPFSKDFNGISAIYQGLCKVGFATYIYMKGLDLEKIQITEHADFSVILNGGRNYLKTLLRALPEHCRTTMINVEARRAHFPLCYAAKEGLTGDMKALVKAGVDIEFNSRQSGTALLTACLAGQLKSVKFLVRCGAKIAWLRDGVYVSALHCTRDWHEITAWLLVGRYTDQAKLSSTGAQPEQETCKWSGIRELSIVLDGPSARLKQSRIDYITEVYRMKRQGRWREFVPLGWKPIEHMVPLPGEKGYMRFSL